MRIGGDNIPFLLEHCPRQYLEVNIRLDLKWSNHIDMVYAHVRERSRRMARLPTTDVQGMQMIAEALRPGIAYSLPLGLFTQQDLGKFA